VSGRIDLIDRMIALLPRLRRFALTLTRNAADADDLAQSTIERALSRLDTWKEDSRLDSWLFKIMQNHWIDQVRSRRTRGIEDSDFDLSLLAGDDGREITDIRLTLKATLEAVLKLPEDQRAAMLLVVVDGFSYREAADILEIPIGTVMSRLSRARQALEAEVYGAGGRSAAEAVQ
jgi:RNA polymerase sigma-70 factor (ECF subfamily)